MTRAKDISKILTDADLSGNLDVTGTVTAGGNVGIGTSSPDTTTQISKSTTSTDGSVYPTLKVENTSAGSGNSYARFQVNGGNGTTGFTLLADGRSSNSDVSLRTTTNTPMSFYTNNSERMRIDSSGNVGIGTSSPNRMLTLENGDIQIHDSGTGDPLLNFSVGGTQASPTQSWTFRIDNSDSDKFQLMDVTDSRIVLTADGSGNVGIGLSSPQELLHIKDGDIAVGNGTASNNTVIGRIGFSTDASNSRFIGIESFRGGDAANADLRFHTFGGDGNNGERMRIDTAGRVMIGTTTAGESSADDLTIATTGQTGITIRSGTANAGSIYFSDATSGTGQYSGYMFYDHNTNSLAIGTNATERMRINSSGNVGIGDSSNIARLMVQSNFSSFTGVNIKNNHSVATGFFINFTNTNGTQAGGISHNGSTTVAYNTSSDHRLKENVTADWDATTRLKQLNPVRFNFIADADTTVDGFIAHEVQEVVPEAITGTKDAVDDDGNPVYQGIDQSKLVPLLVKTIQELEARIVALETA